MRTHRRLYLLAIIAGFAWGCSNREQPPKYEDAPSIQRQLQIADSAFEQSGAQAIPYYRNLYQRLEEISPKDRALVVSRLAETWHNEGQHDSAYNLLTQVLNAETIIQDTLSLLSIRLTKARLHQDLEQVDSAESNLLKCLEIAEKLNLKEIRFKATFGLANAYSSYNQIGKSQQLYFKLIPEAIELKDSGSLANIYQNIAFNFQLKNNLKDAIKYYSIAKSYLLSKPSSLPYAEILNNIGTCYNSAELYDSALNNYIAAEMIFRMKNNKTGIMRTLFNQANIKQRQGKYKEAELSYQNILKDSRTYNIKIAEGYVLSELAMLQFRQGHYESAIQLIDSSYNFLFNNDIVARCHEILNNREEILVKAVGNDKSHRWWKEQEILRAKINNPAEDSLLVQSEKNDTKIPQTSPNLGQKESSNNRSFMIGGILAVLTLITLVWYRRRIAKHQQMQVAITPDQIVIWEVQFKERIIEIMEKKQLWKSPKFNTQAMSAELGISKQLLEPIIKNLFEQSPERFILKYRISLACELLDDPASTWMNTEQIAESCGFNSVTSFYKGFAAITGIQPGDYQKRKNPS